MSRPGPYRLPSGGRVDRTRPLRFTFDGREYAGFAGDTLASALLANGVRVTGRSFKYHRPRGVMAAASDEANTLVQLGVGARTEPNLKATEVELCDGLVARAVNCWPSARFDVFGVLRWAKPLMPAGFYYKTFIAPHWHWYEGAIRRMAGLGHSPTAADPDHYEQHHVSCDTLVVGAGPAGLAAARAAAASGASVLLVDAHAQVAGLRAGARDALPANVTTKLRTTVFGGFDHNQFVAVEVGDGRPRQRLWRIRAHRAVFATGAFERPLVFPHNDRPGVMLASAARTYLERFGVAVGRRVVVATNNDGGLEVARTLEHAGVAIAAIADLRAGLAPTDTRGVAGLSAVELHTIDAQGRAQPGTGRWIDADALLVSGGWNPAVHLFSHAGGALGFDESLQAFVPKHEDEGRSGISISCVGAAAGRIEAGKPAPIWEIDVTALGRDGRKAWVDLQSDVTAEDLRLAVRENFRAIEHVKRYTTTGMMTDQGKTSNVNAIGIVANVQQLSPAALGTTKFRPPFTPVTFGAIAGRHLGRFYRPLRESPIHAGHQQLEAVFDEYGGWLRPAWYRSNGGDEAGAIAREVAAVRTSLGVFDASSLGKILVHGPDAATFLNRIYVNNVATLKPGHCRYTLMLGEDGIVKDDGICTRLAEDRFLVGTTTGGAGAIADWLEEWLQGEWPDLEVATEPVTTQWATVNIAGPKARALLESLQTGIDLAAFPHMTARDGLWRGWPLRAMRVSYSGEYSYELSVPARSGLALWEQLMTLGQAMGAVPFGVEAMLRLRMEKGFMLVGEDTDGMTLPQDVGFGEIAFKKPGDFVGRRSLTTPDARRANRRQFVGLEPLDGRTLLPVGAHVVAPGAGAPPARTQGWVTSSFAPAGRAPVALGMVEAGTTRIGQEVVVVDDGRRIPARIRVPCFHDPAGERLRD